MKSSRDKLNETLSVVCGIVVFMVILTLVVFGTIIGLVIK